MKIRQGQFSRFRGKPVQKTLKGIDPSLALRVLQVSHQKALPPVTSQIYWLADLIQEAILLSLQTPRLQDLARVSTRPPETAEIGEASKSAQKELEDRIASIEFLSDSAAFQDRSFIRLILAAAWCIKDRGDPSWCLEMAQKLYCGGI